MATTKGIPGEDVLMKFATEAAQTLVDTYYPTLQSSRDKISLFYAPSSTGPDSVKVPTIVFNGNQIESAAEMQSIFQNQMPPCHYEVQSFDCHIINRNYGGAEGSNKSGKNISVVVQVSGYVRYGERDEREQGFSESIVLVPNKETARTRSRMKDWLIQSQTFRIVV